MTRKSDEKLADILESIRTDLRLLQDAVENDDPKPEIKVRIFDLQRRILRMMPVSPPKSLNA